MVCRGILEEDQGWEWARLTVPPTCLVQYKAYSGAQHIFDELKRTLYVFLLLLRGFLLPKVHASLIFISQVLF